MRLRVRARVWLRVSDSRVNTLPWGRGTVGGMVRVYLGKGEG